MIHAAGDQKIRDPFHITDAQTESVRPKSLTEKAAFFICLHKSRRGSQFGQQIVEESPVKVDELMTDRIRIPRKDLSSDLINSRNCLSAHRPEVMSFPAAKPAMYIVVLNDMSDIFHSALFAPSSKLPGEVLRCQFCHRIHIGIAYLCTCHPVF